MNKLGNALYEIHHMDMLAAKDQWVNKIHPLVKLVLTIVFLTVTMSFPKACCAWEFIRLCSLLSAKFR